MEFSLLFSSFQLKHFHLFDDMDVEVHGLRGFGAGWAVGWLVDW